jgi:hypothetical protein
LAAIILPIAASAALAGEAAWVIAAATTVAAAAGAFIDRNFLFPVKGVHQEGPRLDDIAISTAAEGSPVPVVLGGAYRVGGQLMAAGALIEVATTHKQSGGKGGGGGSSTTTYAYFRHCAYAFGEGTGTIRRIWFDNRLVHATGTVRPSLPVTAQVFYGPSGVQAGIHRIWGFAVPVGTADYMSFGDSSLLEGRLLNVFGDISVELATVIPYSAEFPGGVDPTREVWRAVQGDPGDSDSLSIGKSLSGAITLRDLPPLWDAIRLYDGSADQEVDSLLEEISPIADSPAYRGTVHVVFERLQLEKWGNRLPSVTVEMTGQPGTEAMSGAIAWLLDRAGIGAARRSVDAFDSLPLAGMLVSPGDTAQPLAQLLSVVDGVARQRAGIIDIIPRARPELVAIDPLHLGTRGPAGGDARRLQLSRVTDETGLPRRAITHYADADAEYERATQDSARHAALVTARSEITVNLDTVVLGADKAREIANRALWRPWIERESGALSLPPAYFKIEGADWITLPWGGQIYTMRVVRRERRPDFTVAIDVVTVGAVPDPNAGAGSYNQPGLPYLPSVITLFLLELPPLLSDQVALPGYIVTMRPFLADDFWVGATLLEAASEAGPYAAAASILGEGRIGYAATALGTGPRHTWDMGNTVDLAFDRSEGPESVTQAQVLDGANALLLGEEIIQFRDAAMIAADTWRLSVLLRGRRGTRMVAHDAGEQAIILSGGSGLTWRGIEPSAIGQSTYLRALPRDGEIDQTAIVPFAPTARNLRPFSPCHFAYDVTPAGDIAMTWVRRDRAPWRLLAGDTPMSEAVERYRVRILAGSTVVRSIIANSAAATYTAAQQTADFGGPASGITLSVSQYSAVVGYGDEEILEIP